MTRASPILAAALLLSCTVDQARWIKVADVRNGTTVERVCRYTDPNFSFDQQELVQCIVMKPGETKNIYAPGNIDPPAPMCENGDSCSTPPARTPAGI